MTEPTAALTERQARSGVAVAREFIDGPDVGCPYGSPAWHRAVDRLIRIHRGEYKRLLAEEHAKGEQP